MTLSLNPETTERNNSAPQANTIGFNGTPHSNTHSNGHRPEPLSRQWARVYRAAGLNPLPIATDGSKAPPRQFGEWAHLKERLITDAELLSFTDNTGIAIIGGKVSGNLERLDFDRPGIFDCFATLCHDEGIDEWLEACPLIQTPAGGHHVYYRCAEPVSGNLKLARHFLPCQPDEPNARLINGQWGKVKTLVETRGEAGYTLAPGSPAACHESGRLYEVVRGDLQNVPTIPAAIREAFLNLARALNEFVDPQNISSPPSSRAGSEGNRPGDDFNRLGDISSILEKHGWRRKGSRGEKTYWQRPGKEGRGISATENYADTRLFYVFSSNASPFESERAYTKFTVFAMLEHGGNFSAAARELKAQGFGQKVETAHSENEGHLTRQNQDLKTDSAPTSFPLDEVGNGVRFASQHGADMRFCSVRGSWLLFKDGRWQVDEHGEAERRAKQIAREVVAEASREADDDRRSRLLKHALTLTKRATRETMLKDAASEPGMMVTLDEFDTKPCLFNVSNGTLDLETITLRPHEPRNLLSHFSNVIYDRAATCPTWRRCMERWIPDAETREHVQDAAGVSLTGVVYDEFFIFLFGDGQNGKSSFLRTLELLAGTYGAKTEAETIMMARDQRKAGTPAPELIALKGARLVTVHEIDSRHHLNATLVKDLTGRDSITARGLFDRRMTTFVPQFTLWMFGNSKPRITDTSGGIWRRPRLIEFGSPIPADERDPRLSDKLRAELPGILNWALDGLRRVHERGLTVPDAVKAAVENYRSEQDPLANFLSDCCVVGPDFKVSANELWRTWCSWCSENGEREGAQRSFGIELTRRKFDKYSNNGIWRRGIGLKATKVSQKAIEIDDSRNDRNERKENPQKFLIETSHVETLPEIPSVPSVPSVPSPEMADTEVFS